MCIFSNGYHGAFNLKSEESASGITLCVATKNGIAMKMSRGEMVRFARALGYNYDPETKTISIKDRIAGAGGGDGGVLPCEPGLSAAGRNRVQQQGKEGFTDNGLFPASLVRIPFSDWHTGLSKKRRYKCSDPGYSIIH